MMKKVEKKIRRTLAAMNEEAQVVSDSSESGEESDCEEEKLQQPAVENIESHRINPQIQNAPIKVRVDQPLGIEHEEIII